MKFFFNKKLLLGAVYVVLLAGAVAVSMWHLFIISSSYISLVWIPIMMLIPALVFYYHASIFKRLLWIDFYLYLSMLLMRILLDLWLPVTI